MSAFWFAVALSRPRIYDRSSSVLFRSSVSITRQLQCWYGIPSRTMSSLRQAGPKLEREVAQLRENAAKRKIRFTFFTTRLQYTLGRFSAFNVWSIFIFNARLD